MHLLTILSELIHYVNHYNELFSWKVRVISHQNLQRLLGVSVDDDGFCIYLIEELCQKGS